MISFLNKYKYQISLFFLLGIPTLFVMHENVGRGIFLLVSLFLWLIFSIYTKKLLWPSLMYIILVLPFNISMQLPFPPDYVNGVYVNYLVPTISIIDIGIFLLLTSYVFEYGFKKVFLIIKKYWIWLVLLTIFFIIQTIFKWNTLTAINSGRLLSYILSFILLIEYLKKDFKKENIKYTLWVLIFVTVIQGVIGILQFTRGSSLGLTFIGESQVVSGMVGSSFVTLNGGVFLRAYGTFPHPNILGGFFVLVSLLCVYLYPKVDSLYKKIIIFLCILVGGFVTFTFSRIGIALVFGIFFVTMIFPLFKGKLFSFPPLLLLERFLNVFSDGDTSWSDRVNLVKASFNVIKENVLIGTGIGGFVKGMEDYVPRTVNGILLLQPVHNVLLLMLSEVGIVGIGLLVGLLINIVRVNRVRIGVFKWLVVFVFIIICCFDHYLWSLPQGMIMGMIGLILVMV